ncbi:MAG: M20/M25/M40 family metallo-hydrolase [Firmicutes bacterium]|nr:M20/M25/M40 family metallo-hydrolase [Bacillota bacterium]
MQDFGSRMERLAIELVRLRSVVGTEGELGITLWIKDRLSGLPYFAMNPDRLVFEAIPGDKLGRGSLMAIFEAARPTSDAVLLIGHTDTVGLSDYAAAEPFATDPSLLPQALQAMELDAEAKADLESGDYLFGRGIFDMKAGVAALMLLAEELSCKAGDLAANFVFAFVPDEEGGSLGMLTAVRRLALLSKERGWSFNAAIDTDYMTGRFNEDHAKYVYLGTVGKLLPSIYVHGSPTHVGEAFGGMDANFLAAAIMHSIDMDPGLCDELGGEATQPPISLRMRDLKEEYSVQTTDGAFLYFNYATHASTPDEVMAKLKARIEAVMESAAAELARRSMEHSALSGAVRKRAYRVPSVMSYDELLSCVRKHLGEGLDEVISGFVKGAGMSYTDPRDFSLALVREVHRYLPDQGPKAVIFFSPPYYPHITAEAADLKAQRLIQAASGAVEEARVRFPYEIGTRKFYPYISDLSYCRLPAKKGAVEALVENMPAWPEKYVLPLQDIATLDMPVINIGPYGKDAHRPTERLCRDYSLDAMPFILKRVLELLTGMPLLV